MFSPEESRNMSAGWMMSGAMKSKPARVNTAMMRRFWASSASRSAEVLPAMGSGLAAAKPAANGFDKLGLGHGYLGGPLFAPGIAASDYFSGARARRQVLDLHFAPGTLVISLNDGEGGATPVRIFHLRLQTRKPKIELGADAGVSQLNDHALILRQAGTVHHQNHDRATGPCGLQAAKVVQSRVKAGNSDREAGCRNLLAAKTRDEIVITPAAADGAEAHELTFLIACLKKQLGFEHRAGVISKASNDGGVEAYPIFTITSSSENLLHLFQLRRAFGANPRAFNRPRGKLRRGGKCKAPLNLQVAQPCAFGEIARFILATLAKQLGDPCPAQAVKLIDCTKPGHASGFVIGA